MIQGYKSKTVHLSQVMTDIAFVQGWRDIHLGTGAWPRNYDRMDILSQQRYERGRLVAVLHPGVSIEQVQQSIRLKHG